MYTYCVAINSCDRIYDASSEGDLKPLTRAPHMSAFLCQCYTSVAFFNRIRHIRKDQYRTVCLSEARTGIGSVEADSNANVIPFTSSSRKHCATQAGRSDKPRTQWRRDGDQWARYDSFTSAVSISAHSVYAAIERCSISLRVVTVVRWMECGRGGSVVRLFKGQQKHLVHFPET